MKLTEVINERIELLEKERERIKTTLFHVRHDNAKVSYGQVNYLFNKLKKPEDIRNASTSLVSNVIATYFKKNSSAELENKLREIKVTYKAKYDKGIKVELSNSQVDFLNNYIRDVEKLLSYLERKVKENEEKEKSLTNEKDLKKREVERFREVLQKIENNELLDEMDFNLICKIVDDENIDYETKKELLIEFRNYNNSITKKQEETTIEETIVEEKEEETLPLEEVKQAGEEIRVKSLFEQYGYSNTMFKYINKFKKELDASLDIDEARRILDYFNEQNILKRFVEADLLAICTYGTLESVTNMYEKLKSDNNHMYSVFYEAPTIWVDKQKRGIRKKRSKDGKGLPKEPIGILKTSVMKASYEDMLLNNQFFKDHGYDINIKYGKNKLALTTPHSKVLENYAIFERYGIHKNAGETSSMFGSTNITDKLDKFIELGLLYGHNGSFDNGNYIMYNPSFIFTASNIHFAYFYNMREEEPPHTYYFKLFSDIRDGEMKKEYKQASSVRDKMRLPVDEFIKEKFIDPSTYLRNFDYYENIINNAEDTSIDPEIFSTPEIIELERSAKISGNEYVYVIGDLDFSRLKVLRNYSIIRRYSKEIYEDALMYAITRGSYLSEEAVMRVSDYIMYTYTNTSTKIGGNHGLFKSI